MKIDLEKRRRVMERSQRLGHCICDPRRPCPCDVFRQDRFCPCAGERPEAIDLSQVRLTQWVHNAGCASKIAPADLDAVLSRLPPVRDPAVLSGLAAADDAAIYRLNDQVCLVQTVDVFTPCVDDPRLFGRICAANCLSDIYAMGGEPRTALSILAFPSETLDGQIMFEMLAGAMETLEQAGVALVGGHSIKDDEIKLGFAITGAIDLKIADALETPRPGDALVLTKPLGTGILAFGRQVGRVYAAGLTAAEASMASLNRAASKAMIGAGASACTDITGFGLFGHLLRLARQAKLSARVFADTLPAFDGVLDALRAGVVPGAVERNREYVGAKLSVEPGVDEIFVHLGCDPQTSGGLLIAIAPSRLPTLLSAMAQAGVTGVAIGRFSTPSEAVIHLYRSAVDSTPSLSAPPVQRVAGDLIPISTMNATPEPTPHSADCCADVFPPNPSSPVSETQRAFGAFMRAVQAGGALDARTKELILFSLVVFSRCQPCFHSHHEKALQMGISQAELEEAAWCAIALGGSPVRMFYQESTARK
jgi:selenide,water dikinase